MVTLITVTGSRPEAFALCEQYVKRQTYKGPLQWIVVDDSLPATPCTMNQDRYAGPKVWKKGINTQRLNLDFAIPKIKGDKVFILEDDDLYHPDYLAVMCDLLNYVPIVGEANAHYYHIGSASYKNMDNFYHASLCSTAFRRELIPTFEEAVNSGELYIDIALWRKIKERNIPNILMVNYKTLCVGIKGMPGRAGIGVGHSPCGFAMDSSNYGKLREWIGEDVELYKKWLPKRG